MPKNPLIARLCLEFQRLFAGINIPPKMTIKSKCSRTLKILEQLHYFKTYVTLMEIIFYIS